MKTVGDTPSLSVTEKSHKLKLYPSKTKTAAQQAQPSFLGKNGEKEQITRA